MSVNIIVQELEKEPHNSVLIYKPQGTVMQEYPAVQEESFVLAIQTEFQQELYRRHCNKILCIDATHKTNAYRFKLITCMVPDEFGQGIVQKIYTLQGSIQKFCHGGVNLGYEKKRGGGSSCPSQKCKGGGECPPPP